MRWFLATATAAIIAGAGAAQDATPAMLAGLKPRHIGPANMSGRIPDVAVYEKEPRIQYVATAAAGVWKTVNLGTTWTPLLEREATSSVGAVAVFQQNPDIVWAGMGEANARNSVSWGDGVRRSTDGGKTWKHLGLRDTQHIGRIILHPSDPNVAYVAALGRVWGPNPERGVFKTTDAGASWQKVLYKDENTGAVDLAMDPVDPNRLYACLYQVRRDAFSGGNPKTQTGPHAGIYLSTDGGTTWTKAKDGLPTRPMGRCGVSVCRAKPNVVYAVVQTDKTVATVAGQTPNKTPEQAVGGIFRSDDHGKTWKQVNSLVTRPFYYGQIRVDPVDENRVYVLGVKFHVSTTGGAKFTDTPAKGTHVDYHALWIDPKNPHFLVLGCDGGLNYSYDKADTWEHLKNLPISQFYAIGLDLKKPYSVYGGLQDNGTWGGPTRNRNFGGVTLADWQNLLGFDGYYAQVDPEDDDTVFCEGQYGILRRVNLKTGEAKDIKPRLADKTLKTNLVVPAPAKFPGFRFNWSSPIQISPHAPKTVYFCGNHVFRSDDRGVSWHVVSPDLTFGKPGPSDYSGHTISAFDESKVRKGRLVVGTDDGRLHVTDDGGQTWADLSSTLPPAAARWISRVEWSPHEVDHLYVAVDRHRNDDAKPYLYRSRDVGRTWEPIVGDLPPVGHVLAFRSDPKRPDLLLAGTEFGLFVSLDGGKAWHKQKRLPTLPIHDLAIHPRERELVIATHGRGIYVQDWAPMQELTAETSAKDVWLFSVAPAEAFRERSFNRLGVKAYTGDNPPRGAAFWYRLKSPVAEPPVVTILDPMGKKLVELKGAKDAGLHRVGWNLMRPGTTGGLYRPVANGTYTAVLKVGAQELRKEFSVTAEE